MGHSLGAEQEGSAVNRIRYAETGGHHRHESDCNFVIQDELVVPDDKRCSRKSPTRKQSAISVFNFCRHPLMVPRLGNGGLIIVPVQLAILLVLLRRTGNAFFSKMTASHESP